jgi:DNA-directed RNA polymerase specialized sigma24 family protein
VSPENVSIVVVSSRSSGSRLRRSTSRLRIWPYDRAVVAAIYRALDQVAPDDRIAFVLHHVEGERLESVARLCGCSITTAKRRISRARTTLERKLSDD